MQLGTVLWNSSVVPTSISTDPSGNPVAAHVCWRAPPVSPTDRPTGAAGDDPEVDAVFVENNTVLAGVLVVPFCLLAGTSLQVLLHSCSTARQRMGFLLTCVAIGPQQWPHVHVNLNRLTKPSIVDVLQVVEGRNEAGWVHNTGTISTHCRITSFSGITGTYFPNCIGSPGGESRVRCKIS